MPTRSSIPGLVCVLATPALVTLNINCASATPTVSYTLSKGTVTNDPNLTFSFTTGTSAYTAAINFGNVLIGDQASVVTTYTNKSTTATQNATFTTVPANSSKFGGGGVSKTGVTANGGTYSGNSYTLTAASRGTLTNSPATVTGTQGTSSSTTNVTLSGVGVAPKANITGAAAGVILVGTTKNVAINVNNSGNGNLSNIAGNTGTGTTSSDLIGKFTTATGVVSGPSSPGSSIDLKDGASQNYTFAVAPTVRSNGVQQSAQVGANFYNGVDGTSGVNKSGTVTTAVTYTAVAPVESTSVVSNGPTVRIGTSGTLGLQVTNNGDGNQANGQVTSSGHTLTNADTNLQGTVPSVTSGQTASFTDVNANTTTVSTPFSGPSGGSTAINLQDGQSANYTYNFTPTDHGQYSQNVNVQFTNGNSNGTNAAETTPEVLQGVGVGPQYAATDINGNPVVTGSTIDLGTTRYAHPTSYSLVLNNLSTDAASGDLTDMTIESIVIGGPGAGEFTYSGIAPGDIISEGSSETLSIEFLADLFGTFDGTITIYTDENAALGGAGDIFSYNLTATAMPEPASLVLFGIPALGLGLVRRRRPTA